MFKNRLFTSVMTKCHSRKSAMSHDDELHEEHFAGAKRQEQTSSLNRS